MHRMKPHPLALPNTEAPAMHLRHPLQMNQENCLEILKEKKIYICPFLLENLKISDEGSCL